jgi:hypothetical protein
MVMLVLAVLSVFPARLAADSNLSLPSSLNERIEIMTDRNIYAVGEKILFAGINIIPQELDTTCWSQVLYMELLTPGGTTVARGKFPMRCSLASGYLNIPEDLLTGNYYLVTYTKWMRNFSPSCFHYRLVKIINPFSPQLETSNLSNGEGQTLEWEQKPVKASIACITDRAFYGQREKVSLTISIPEASGSLTNTYSVTVVRKGLNGTMRTLEIRPEMVQDQRHPGIMYLPETSGLSLSGSMVSMDSSTFIPEALVSLAVLGRKPEYRVIRSGPGGSFCFALDSMHGQRDLYITSNHEDRHFAIRIDNDFANPLVKFPEMPFILSESEKELASEIIFNMQVSSHFHSNGKKTTEPPEEGQDTLNRAFYGLPSNTVFIDDYIELPTLKEVLIELVPGVFPRVRNNEPYLIFTGNKLTFTLINQYSPLLMIDHVPVNNLEGMLLMSPKKIQRVEMLNEIYIIGNTTYGGILNIITKKGDLGGIDLPEHSFFFDFTAFLPQDELVFPQYEDQEFDPENPDYRNCLYWAPRVRVSPGQQIMLDFYTSDNSGDYRVLIRGVAPDGSILQGSCDFRVE